MAKKDRLKNGLDMLFEDNISEDSQQTGKNDEKTVQTLRLSLIEPDKTQPRTHFDEERLSELADNIAQHGVLQPILVRPIENGGYRIVAGERRWRAARMAELEEVPVVIREMSDFEAAQIALIENLQREDLNPIEEAMAYQRLSEVFGMTHEQIAKSVGKSRAAIANSVRMLKLEESVKNLVADKKLSVGHAKVLCGISSASYQKELAERCAINALTVRELERIIVEDSKFIEGGKVKLPDFANPVKKRAVETELSLKQMYGIDAKVTAEKNGKFTLKLTFANEKEMMDFISGIAVKH
jgi:ParB family chromosome partitioning protein